jgi:hypothetical protein
MAGMLPYDLSIVDCHMAGNLTDTPPERFAADLAQTSVPPLLP